MLELFTLGLEALAGQSREPVERTVSQDRSERAGNDHRYQVQASVGGKD
jgi:hypothetical protein